MEDEPEAIKDAPEKPVAPRKPRAPRKFSDKEPYSMVYDRNGMQQYWQNGHIYNRSTGDRMD